MKKKKKRKKYEPTPERMRMIEIFGERRTVPTEKRVMGITELEPVDDYEERKYWEKQYPLEKRNYIVYLM